MRLIDVVTIAWVDCVSFGIAGSAMDNLAVTYSELGRHADALVLFERVLELYRRVLPEGHPRIGEVD